MVRLVGSWAVLVPEVEEVVRKEIDADARDQHLPETRSQQHSSRIVTAAAPPPKREPNLAAAGKPKPLYLLDRDDIGLPGLRILRILKLLLRRVKEREVAFFLPALLEKLEQVPDVLGEELRRVSNPVSSGGLFDKLRDTLKPLRPTRDATATCRWMPLLTEKSSQIYCFGSNLIVLLAEIVATNSQHALRVIHAVLRFVK